MLKRSTEYYVVNHATLNDLIYSFFFSLHHVRVPRPEHCEEGGEGLAQGGRGNQVRDSADQAGQSHVSKAAIQVF